MQIAKIAAACLYLWVGRRGVCVCFADVATAVWHSGITMKPLVGLWPPAGAASHDKART